MADVGRPSVMTPETLAKLEEGFLMGFTDREASLFAGINPSTLYRYCEDNPEYSERKELLKENVKMIAKKNIYTEIGAGDKQLSQWYTERRDPEFKAKQDITTDNQPILQLKPEEKAQLDNILAQNT